MGTVTSTLLMQMLWNGSAAAKKAQTDMKNVDAAANRLKGRKTVADNASHAAIIGGGKMILGAAASYYSVGAARDTFTAYADFDRRMTRIRQTADASVAEAEQAKGRIRQVAQDVALPLGEVMGGVEDLVASGRSLGETMAFLPAVAKTAQASGAAVGDIAKTADAIGTSMGIAGDQMQRAFDILVQQGKAGKFELKDMAQYLPSLAPAAAAVGLKGVEGLNQLAAVLQTVRTQTGSAGEAATSVQNIFAKMESQETAKAFKKLGVDLPKEMTKARKEGKNLLDVFLQLSEKALKGDLSKIPQLFRDMEFARGMRALLSNKAALQAFIAEISKAGGAVERDLVAPTNDARAGVDRLANSWSRATTSLGNLGDAAGLTKFLEAVASTADQGAANIERLANNIRKYGTKKGIETFFAENEKAEKERLQKETEEADRRRGYSLPTVEESKRQDDARLRLSQMASEIDKRERTFVATEERWKGKKLPPAAVEQRQNAINDLRKMYAELTNVVVETLPPLLSRPEELGSVPKEFKPRSRWKGSQPPSSKTFGEGVMGPFAQTAPPTPSNLIIQLDDASATAAANAAREKVQAILNANPPVIKPRVEMPSIPSASTAGSYSDNGGRR